MWQDEHRKLDEATAVTGKIGFRVHPPRHESKTLWMCEAWHCVNRRFETQATGNSREEAIENARAQLTRMIEAYQA